MAAKRKDIDLGLSLTRRQLDNLLDIAAGQLLAGDRAGRPLWTRIYNAAREAEDRDRSAAQLKPDALCRASRKAIALSESLQGWANVIVVRCPLCGKVPVRAQIATLPAGRVAIMPDHNIP